MDEREPFSVSAEVRLLLVEPNPSAAAVTGRRLSETGYRVTTVGSAEHAMAELRRRAADLVLAELTLPATSGIELTRMIRDDGMLRDTPVILITGRSDANGAVRAFEVGADDIVAKPFHPEVLLARIARQLARAQAIRELKADNAALDARVVTRAIELGETRLALQASEDERCRLAALVSH